MNKLKSYIADSYNELRYKVSWPTLKELQGSSVLVLVASFIMAGIVYLLDASFGQVMKLIYDTVY
ncbi:preprotein translocase subunit SecE [bacterium SCSIO 12643]|nr:preprotein translocase subunit SecE [bacterium SCSIO 12643]